MQEQVNKLEKHVANTAAELAAQQDRADALTAHIARGPAQAGGTQPASSEAGVGGVGGATTSVQQYEPTLAPIPGSPSVPVHAQQGLTGTHSFPLFKNVYFLPIQRIAQALSKGKQCER